MYFSRIFTWLLRHIEETLTSSSLKYTSSNTSANKGKFSTDKATIADIKS